MSAPSPAPPLPLRAWSRAVVKVGSALVAPGGRGCRDAHTAAIAAFVAASRSAGREVVLVSSGAVAAGLATRPAAARRRRTIPEKQALAALGQPLLMAHWSRLTGAPCAQMLLTHDDLAHRARSLNARNALAEMLALGVLPVVNENDTVAVEELRVGDNDNLAAHVAVLADADLLVICTDIDGLYDADPRAAPGAALVPLVARVDAAVYAMAGGAHDPAATGGMRTKVEAADKATARGIDTVIVNGTRPEALAALAAGEIHGTLFRAQDPPLAKRKHWMRHAAPVAGRIAVDAGAADALRRRGASLLPSGVVGVDGRFAEGDAVEVTLGGTDPPERLARGISRYAAGDLRRIAGHQSHEIEALLGDASTPPIVIHRDDLVLYPAGP